MFWLTLALALLIGVALGLLGGGGSILAVPLLVYVAGADPKDAIAMSLFVVGATSLAALVSHARGGRVRWKVGVVFGVASMAGAYVGGRLAEFVPGSILLTAFAAMMLVTAVAMIRGRRNGDADEGEGSGGRLRVVRVLVQGVGVGLVTGLVGAGGGFLVVPALVLLGGMPMTAAVGTSLLVIAMNSFAGFAGHLTSAQIDWRLTLAVTAAAIVGAVLGGVLAGKVPQAALRKGFGWFVLAMGVVVLAQSVLGA